MSVVICLQQLLEIYALECFSMPGVVEFVLHVGKHGVHG